MIKNSAHGYDQKYFQEFFVELSKHLHNFFLFQTTVHQDSTKLETFKVFVCFSKC